MLLPVLGVVLLLFFIVAIYMIVRRSKGKTEVNDDVKNRT